jgi:D-alanyl-D-alanine carboxypeptidase
MDLYNVDSITEQLTSPTENNNYQRMFLTAMNEKAKSLGTSDTIFYNPHGNDGYETERNLSTAMEMAKLCFTVL